MVACLYFTRYGTDQRKPKLQRLRQQVLRQRRGIGVTAVCCEP
jgi:hypothetical protein